MLGCLLSALFYTEVAKPLDEIPVTYYSMVKLEHAKSKLHMASIELAYQSGSCQQITRAIPKAERAEAYWGVYPLPGENREQGEKIKCNSELRFKHAGTGGFLHSHDIKGQFGSGHEVSCFDGGDSGDNWRVLCSDEYWTHGSTVKIQHVDTGYYLSVNTTNQYPKELGMEYELFAEANDDNEWSVAGGVFTGVE